MLRLLSFLFLVSAFFSCLPEKTALERALREAGDNRMELEKVLAYYRDDTLKYQAACFLIENMPDQYAVLPLDSTDTYARALLSLDKEDPVSWEISRSLVAAVFDSISKIQPESRIKIVRDIEVMTSDYLIENIESAFKIWNRRGVAKHYSFDDFCSYVLPYRVAHEPLSHWRRTALQRYGHWLDSLNAPQDIARSIAMRYPVRYNAGMTKYPYIMSYEEMDSLQWGTCDDMTAFLTLSLRAIGIPAATDVVKAWANRSSAHCWNVVKDTAGHFVDIGYGPDGKNFVVYKVSKVYRMQYRSPGEEDVTQGYDMPLSDVSFPLDGKNKQAYLCTFNNSQWIPVALASSGNGNVTFRNLGRGLLWGDNKIDGYREEGKGIAYLPVVHERGILKPFAAPVILYEGGEVRSLRPILSDTESVTLHRKYPKYNKIASDVHDSNEVVPGDDYELFYWNDEWCSLGRKTAGHDTLVYVEVPKNALLWLHNHTQGKEERIFTYESGKQIWW